MQDPRLELETLAELTRWHARERGAAIALCADGREVTFAELEARSNRVANALRAEGLRPGARVAVLAKDGASTFELLFGVAKAGGVTMGLNWRLAPGELRFMLEDGEAELLFVGAEFLARVEGFLSDLPLLERTVVLSSGGSGAAPAADVARPDYEAWRDLHAAEPLVFEVGPEDVAVQMYTSGTTGLPKGVQLAHRSFFAVVRSMLRAGDPWIGFDADDVSLHNIPAFHIGGLWWAVTTLAVGARLVVLDAFSAPRVLASIEGQRVTKACMVPAMIQMVLAEPRCAETDFSSLDTLVYGGSPIPVSLLQRGLATFGCDFAQIYGLTETGNTAVCLRPASHLVDGRIEPDDERLRAAGQPYPGVRLKVIDAEGRELAPREVGEICIHSPANMLGYWKRAEATAETLRDGWIHTGDAGYLDEQGHVYVSDRVKDMIIYAGENIYPAEIENALCSHPSVAEAAVIGVPDERWGELVKAIVVLVPGAPPKPLPLIAHVRARLAEFKVPKSVDFADALPRTPSGKVKKAELRKPYWEGRQRQVN